jgi:3-oxoacyl-[acyl-carrier-protein] synthase III
MNDIIPGGKTFNPVTGVKIIGSSAAFPEPILLPDGRKTQIITNEDIFRMLLGENYLAILADRGMDINYPENVVGIRERAWTHVIGTPADHNEENTVDLGVKAGKGVLSALRISPDDIDFVILSSTTPHKITSSTSCAIAAELNIKAPCLDIKAGCTSGLYALLNASLHVKAGFERVLLIASETPSKYSNPEIHETVLGVGDGAVAFVLGKGEDSNGILGGFLGADGELGKLVHTPGLVPPTHDAIDQGLYYYHGDSSTLKEIVPPRYINAMQGALKVAGLNASQLDLYVPHQVNRYLTKQVAKALEIPEEKQFYNLHSHGSVAGAAVLIALHEAIKEGKIKPGFKVGMNVVGGGLTWGGLVWQF